MGSALVQGVHRAGGEKAGGGLNDPRPPHTCSLSDAGLHTPFLQNGDDSMSPGTVVNGFNEIMYVKDSPGVWHVIISQ